MREPYYVAKLKSDALSTKGLKPLSHIFDFATFRIRLSRKLSRPSSTPAAKPPY